MNYHEPSGTISFYWEFGGGDAIAMISIADLGSGAVDIRGTVKRRRQILERVAKDVVRQKAPTCRADTDDGSGYIYIR